MPKPAHHSGTYQVRAARLVTLAYARDAAAALGECEPTRCWRDGLTLAEHEPHRNGKRPWWTAGHTRDSDPSAPLAPEASTCNFAEGARHGHRLHRRFVPHRPW